MESDLDQKESLNNFRELRDGWAVLSALERVANSKRSAGYSHRELAQAVGCKESLVRQLIKLAELPTTVLEEYEAGEIGRKKALELGKKLQQIKPPRVKRRTRIKRRARDLEQWVRDEMPPYIWGAFFGEVRYETEGPQGAVFKLAAQPARLEDEYADAAEIIAECKPQGPPPESGPEETNLWVEWYARWFQRTVPDRADREEALRIVMGKLVPHM